MLQKASWQVLKKNKILHFLVIANPGYNKQINRSQAVCYNQVWLYFYNKCLSWYSLRTLFQFQLNTGSNFTHPTLETVTLTTYPKRWRNSKFWKSKWRFIRQSTSSQTITETFIAQTRGPRLWLSPTKFTQLKLFML